MYKNELCVVWWLVVVSFASFASFLFVVELGVRLHHLSSALLRPTSRQRWLKIEDDDVEDSSSFIPVHHDGSKLARQPAREAYVVSQNIMHAKKKKWMNE